MAVQAAVAGEADHGHDQLAGAAAGGAAPAGLAQNIDIYIYTLDRSEDILYLL